MINVADLLFEICEDEAVFEENTDLIESGLLDSYAYIELFSRLEDEGIDIQPTRIDRNRLKSVKEIEKMINEYIANQH